MFKKLLIIGFLLMFYGCQSNKKINECCRFHDDGRSKPMVTIVPIIDSTFYDIPWSLSEELSSLINKNISDKGNIFTPKEKENIKLSTNHNPFENNINWSKKMFKNAEFVVFIELTEHNDLPISKTIKNPNKISESRKLASNLNISARLKIIDLRKKKPVIVLQEKIKDSFFMSNTIDKFDYNEVTWGTKTYKKSPMGEAHLQFAKELAD